MRLIRALITLGAAAAVSLLTVQVDAAPPVKPPPAPDYDVKSYPGSLCRPISGTDEYAAYGPGKVQNVDPIETLFITCPIVRDDVMGTDGTYDIIVTINQAVGGPVTCTALSFDVDLSVVEYITDIAVDIGVTELHLDLNESVPNGYFDLLCGLTPGSSLYSYRVYEWQGSYGEMTDYDR